MVAFSKPVADNGTGGNSSSSSSSGSSGSSGTSSVFDGNREIEITTRAYAQLGNEAKRNLLLDFFNSSMSRNKFIEKERKKNTKAASRAAIQTWIKASGIGAMRDANDKARKANDVLKYSEDDAADKINEYITGVVKRKEDGVQLRNELNMYLTLHDQQFILKACALLSSMGHGGGEDMMERVVNAKLEQFTDKRDAIGVSSKVVRLMREQYPDFGKLRTAASIDPARAAKANEDTRDTMFLKLDEYVYLLHRMGVSPWERWADVPARNKYNMDEMGTDTTKHRKKVFAAELFLPLFQITPEGDGKMNRHITLCLTTRADGKYRCRKKGIFDGAPGVMVILGFLTPQCQSGSFPTRVCEALTQNPFTTLHTIILR